MRKGFCIIGMLALLFCNIQLSDSQSIKDSKKKSATIFQYDPARHVRASNGAITVVVDKLFGRFYIETAKGTPILFERDGGMTSYTNIHINDKVFTNNTLNGPQSPWGTMTMPYVNAAALSDRVVCTCDLSYHSSRVQLKQEFIPSLDQDYAYVRIVTTVKNTSSESVSVGELLMMDLMIGTEDYVDVTIDSSVVIKETSYIGNNIPDEFFGKAKLLPLQIKSRLNGNGTTPPDQFVIGNWRYNGFLGAATWDYHASGRSMIDNAVLMQWNDTILQPGEERAVITDHGYIAHISSQLSCSVDSIKYNLGIHNYDPNPFTIRATVRNTGDIPLNNLTLQLGSLPQKISLAPSENVLKNISGPITAGNSASVEWKLVASEFLQATSVSFNVRLINPQILFDSCTAQTVIPMTPKYIASLDCGDTISILLNQDSTEYSNNPFTITATIKNVGNVPLDSLSATVVLPSNIQLVNGTLTKNVLPKPLIPNQSTTVAWDVHASKVYNPVTQNFSIELHGEENIFVQCSQTVSLPAIKTLLPCSENGISTKGTDFWFAFPPNTQGDSAPQLMLYFASDQSTKVTIDRPGIPATTSFIVVPGVLGSFYLEQALNQPSEEQIEKLGIHITADHPVAVYFANLRLRHSDATMILPTHALGKSYYCVGYNWTDAEEHFMICAAEDNTNITINPIASTSTSRPPGVPFRVTLHQGDSYYVHCELGGKFGGLTGSSINADKPIAVIGGGESGHIPYPNPVDYNYLNPHFDQYLPNELLGTEYITVPFRSRLRGDTFKIVATNDNTTLTINSGAPIVLSQLGDYYETILETASHITSDKPILVAQFANSAEYDYPDNEYGDGSMVILSPANRFVTCHSFPTGLGNRFDSSFVNIVVPDGVQRAITLDGNVLSDTTFHRVQNTSFYSAQLMLKSGMHSLETSDARGVGAIVYGFEAHDAFTFNSGFLIQKKLKVTDVENDRVEKSFSIDQINPNPFHQNGTIQFSLPSSGNVTLKIYNVLGKEIGTLVNEYRDAGKYSVNWNAKNISQGVYFCRLISGSNIVTKMIMLVK